MPNCWISLSASCAAPPAPEPSSIFSIIAFLILGSGFTALLILLIITLMRRYERVRTEALMMAATGIGLSLSPVDEEQRCVALHQFRAGSVGTGRKVRNVISGTWSGREVLFFDYRYVVGHGKNRRAYSQSLMLMTLERAFPDFIMCPEGSFSRVGQMFGAADIDFLTHPEFSKSYTLMGKDEDAIREGFSIDLLEYFEGKSGFSLESCCGQLLFYCNNKRCRPDALEAFFEEAFEVADALGGKLP